MKSKALWVFLFAIVALVMVNSVQAETELGFFGLGVKVGFVKPQDIDGTFGLGLQAKLGTIMPQLALDAFIDYWGKSWDVAYFGGNYSWSYTDIAVGAMVKYFFTSESNIKPYAGAGLALHIASAKSETSYGDFSASETGLGVHLAGGIEMPLSDQIDGMAEVTYVLADADYFGIFGGVIYKFGK